MECLNIALDAKRAFDAQRERCISHHEELHSLLSGDFTHDLILVCFYALCEAGGDPSLAMLHYAYRVMSLGYDEEEYSGPSAYFIFNYACEQYLNSDGLSNLDNFKEWGACKNE